MSFAYQWHEDRKPQTEPTRTNHNQRGKLNYLEKGELAAHIIQAQQTGIIHNELCNMLTSIFQGIASRYCFNPQLRKDIVNDCWLRFLEKNTIHKLEPDKNPFNYLTSLAHNHCANYTRRETNRTNRMAELLGNVENLATEKNLI